jgi:hypothetical protein
MGEYQHQNPKEENPSQPRVHYEEQPEQPQPEQTTEIPQLPSQLPSQQLQPQLMPPASLSPRVHTLKRSNAAVPNSPRLTLRRQIIQQQLANDTTLRRQAMNPSRSNQTVESTNSATTNRSGRSNRSDRSMMSIRRVDAPPDDIEGLLPRFVGSRIINNNTSTNKVGSYMRNNASGNATSAMTINAASRLTVDQQQQQFADEVESFEEIDDEDEEVVFVDDEEDLEEYASDNEASDVESEFDDYDEEVNYH